MGTCQTGHCRCQCHPSKVACQCNSSMASEINSFHSPNIESHRSNRFRQSTQQSKKRSPGDSNDTHKHTKSTATQGKRSSKHSSEPSPDPLQSDQCNVKTETETNWVPVRVRVKRRIVTIQQMAPYFQMTQASLTELNLDTFAKSFDEKEPQDVAQFRQKFKHPGTVSDDLQKNQSSEGISMNVQGSFNQAQSGTFSNQISIDKNLYHVPSFNKPQENNSAQFFQHSSMNNMLNKEQTDSPEANIKRSATQAVDRQLSNKSVTPRSALKPNNKSNEEGLNLSFRTQQVQKKQVKFNLPSSHYYREKLKSQQKFFK